MKITNMANLPKAIVDAVTFHSHTQGDYSTTQLQKSPKEFWLQKRHDDEIEVDVSERLWALFGTSVHYVLEKGEDANSFKEEYLAAEISGKKLTGMCDHFNGKIVTDYKVTSVWNIIDKSSFLNWEKQLNIYAFLFGLAGFDVEKIQVIAILRDWQKSKIHDNGYPQVQVQVIPLELWAKTKTRDYIEERIKLLEFYKNIQDDKIPECDPEERWQSKTTYAVMKKGKKRAVRVFEIEDEAKTLAETNPAYSVKIRKGIDKKCVNYCDCNKFCNYYQEKYGNK